MLQPAALSDQSFRCSEELLRGGKAQGSPPPQKSPTPRTAVIAPAVLHSAGTAMSIPSVTAPSHASLTPVTTAPTHPLKDGPI